jgi:DNA modification methylase
MIDYSTVSNEELLELGKEKGLINSKKLNYPDDFINKIICGDCLEVMKDIPDKSIDMILTDIPYGEVNRNSNGLRNLNKGIADIFNLSIKQIIKEFVRIAKGSIYIFCGTEQVSEIRKELVFYNASTRLIIWNKTNPSPMNGKNIWLSSIECCIW